MSETAPSCPVYRENRQDTRLHTTHDGHTVYTCSFGRFFNSTLNGINVLKVGDRIQFQAGFEVFSSRTGTKIAYG